MSAKNRTPFTFTDLLATTTVVGLAALALATAATSAPIVTTPGAPDQIGNLEHAIADDQNAHMTDAYTVRAVACPQSTAARITCEVFETRGRRAVRVVNGSGSGSVSYRRIAGTNPSPLWVGKWIGTHGTVA